jgi:alkylation response protein AidB-like acyl-CoA dehydrogenase
VSVGLRDRALCSTLTVLLFLKTKVSSLVPFFQIKKLGQLGLMGINVSEEYGGPALDSLALSIAVEEIARLAGALHAFYFLLLFFHTT